ncbi:Aromatic amino acid beta-eliminating lyase/threonine aldolase [Penicillium concentricum]|uniref:Aromatic amino acid beta-eliminating lyase/threonine aldolase n=1 Tax=Penicillium concentricum TaxID=293559 RepID=A0A9W9VBV7_9EURO|nr:Aromatic amino acid beta-eliminating lyase/threonine aldolase [Penicillium concentricum]KAJ5374994.1 Aromatic amino acid beta-eliminating lyase/threonine aldolase [Penicillium concentricum]
MPSTSLCQDEACPPYSLMDDYSEGAHPQILEALLRTNSTQQVTYGNDEYSICARQLIRNKIGCDEDEADIFFVPSGTSANLISIASCLRPYEAVITLDSGHIASKEAGAIEATGHKLILVPAVDGKMTPTNLQKALQQNQFYPHMAKPRLLYISNASETGTVYTKRELSNLSAICKQSNLLLFMDGARIGTAICSRKNDLTLREIFDMTDIFWIGGTKAGALMGEAIVVKRALADGFVFHLKQHGALLAKGRILGVQFMELFRSDLFFALATHANEMAQKISTNFEELGYKLAADTETNQVFVILPQELIRRLQDRFRFYVWEQLDDGNSVIRLVTSWATDELEIDKFNAWVQQWTVATNI